MSEYQDYEFVPVDQPLTRDDQVQLRATAPYGRTEGTHGLMFRLPAEVLGLSAMAVWELCLSGDRSTALTTEDPPLSQVPIPGTQRALPSG